MPPQPTTTSCCPETELARVAADRQRPEAERAAALASLDLFLRETARRVTQRHGVYDPECQGELMSFAVLRLWEGAYREDSGPFPAWCRTVMRNRLRDLRRQERRVTERPADITPDPLAELLRRIVEEEQDWRAPFGDEDLARVRSWRNVRHRVIVLCRALLWVKVPAEEWKGWLEDTGLEPLFPPDDFPSWEPSERHRFLADSLGVTLNALHHIWARHCDELLRLEYLQGLL